MHVELFRDEDYTQLLDDWPKDGDHLRSPKYMFGENDPIYVQVNNIGIDPDVAETKYEVVLVNSQSGGPIYLDLKETGVNTEIFRNSIAGRGELLYLSTEDIDDYPVTVDPDKITVMNEEVLNFYLTIPLLCGMYKRSEDVMVDRAEIGTEFQENYLSYCGHPHPPFSYIPTEKFGGQFHDNIGGEPGLVWYKNFRNKDLDSKQVHWHADTDSYYADAVDFVSWSGHNTYQNSQIHLHFFNDSPSCDIFPRASTNLGDKDADWVIFDTCISLDGWKEDLKDELLTSGRCAHMFLGYGNASYWNYPNCGKFFTERLKETTIQQAWFDYCEETLYEGSKVKVFRPVGPLVNYSDESLAGPGPIEVMRDPIATDDWRIKTYEKLTP